MAPMESSGENLISFMNSVTSSVKTVLAKPGCFKRNTNHRRFLQKQLRQTVQQQTDGGPAAPSSNNKNKENNTDVSVQGVLPSALSSISKLQKRKLAKSKSRALKKVKTEYIDIIPVVNDLPSPTFDYNPGSLIDERTYYSEIAPYASSPKRLCLDGTTGFVTEFYTTTTQYSDQSSDNSFISSDSYGSRSNSPVSDADSCCGNNDFLTGEELVKTLDVTDLFVPDDDPTTSKFISTSMYDICMDYTTSYMTSSNKVGDMSVEESRYMIASFERALQKYHLMQF